jgi:hypothetical protein
MNRLSLSGRLRGLRVPSDVSRLAPAVALLGILIAVAADAPVGMTRGIPVDDAELTRLSLPDDHSAAIVDRPDAIPSPLIDPGKSRTQRLRTVRPGVVISRTGASARVAHRHTAKFQCLVDWLDEQGFRIGSMGGIARRPYAGSLHPIGAALDIDQAGRNYLFRGKRFPAGVNDAAAKCGLMHGDRTVWPNYPDYGHFQVAGISRGHFARRHRGEPNTRVARAGQGAPSPADALAVR